MSNQANCSREQRWKIHVKTAKRTSELTQRMAVRIGPASCMNGTAAKGRSGQGRYIVPKRVRYAVAQSFQDRPLRNGEKRMSLVRSMAGEMHSVARRGLMAVGRKLSTGGRICRSY